MRFIYKLKQTATLLFFWAILFFSCRKESTQVATETNTLLPNPEWPDTSLQFDKPNIILILADDVGYEVPTYTGGQSYNTPTLDAMAMAGIQFNQCQVCPNCSPTRIELLTGKYNFRNYFQWGNLSQDQKTIANMLQDAGYKTCVAGKWQLNGGDISIHAFGFDKYRVWLPYNHNEGEEEKYRYKNPRLFENNAYLPESVTHGKYADDMFVDYISDFIDSNKSNPFFIYYPMSLCHWPYSPTPDDPEYAGWDPLNSASNVKFYPSMIKYMDKTVYRVIDKIGTVGLISKTIIIFLGDNGTPDKIQSKFNGKIINGGKNTSTTYGTHVPLVIYWPNNIASKQTSTTLIDASDFLPTIADIAKVNTPTNYGILDGTSFYTTLVGSQQQIRDWSFCYWNPRYRQQKTYKVWVQDKQYKLYNNTNNNFFFNFAKDPLETNPIPDNKLTQEELARKQLFDSVLSVMHN